MSTHKLLRFSGIVVNHDLYSQALEIWRQGPQLNEENYHSSTGFLSNSFIGDFLKCQYSAMIKYAGLGEREDFNQNFAIGHLVEAQIFEGYEGYNRMLKRYGDNALTKANKPYKWASDCLEWADSVLRHDTLKSLLRSPDSIYHKVITFELYGFQWRMEVDYLNLAKKVEVDLKTTGDDFHDRSYNPETKQRDLTFIDKWNYHRQRSIYQYGINQEYDVKVAPHILAVSKKNKSVRLFEFTNQNRLDWELEKLESTCSIIDDVIKGEIEPKQCESCVQCVKDEEINYVIDTDVYCSPWLQF